MQRTPRGPPLRSCTRTPILRWQVPGPVPACSASRNGPVAKWSADACNVRHAGLVPVALLAPEVCCTTTCLSGLQVVSNSPCPAACLLPEAWLSSLQGIILRATDFALGVAVPIHAHVAINGVISDYVPKSVMGATSLTPGGVARRLQHSLPLSTRQQAGVQAAGCGVELCQAVLEFEQPAVVVT